MAQRVLAGERKEGAGLTGALELICSELLWRGRANRDGRAFATFGEFAVAPCPYGLGLNSENGFRELRHSLMLNGRLREWTEVLELIVRRRGRPPGNIANGDICNHAYRAGRSTNAVDYILLRLKRNRPDIFEEVCDRKCTPHQGLIKAGFKRPPSRGTLRYGCCDFQKIGNLSNNVKGKLLCEIFDAVGNAPQRTLLARRIDAALGTQLASEWRETV